MRHAAAAPCLLSQIVTSIQIWAIELLPNFELLKYNLAVSFQLNVVFTQLSLDSDYGIHE